MHEVAQRWVQYISRVIYAVKQTLPSAISQQQRLILKTNGPNNWKAINFKDGLFVVGLAAVDVNAMKKKAECPVNQTHSLPGVLKSVDIFLILIDSGLMEPYGVKRSRQT